MDKPRNYTRFSLSYRIEHWVLTFSFALLAVTGIVQKYPDIGLSRWLIGVMGGIDTTRGLHHGAAIVLMFLTIYHIGELGYRWLVLRVRPTMVPGKADLTNAIQLLRYNVGLSKKRAYQGRFTFEEKLEYWAVVWGTIIMGVTGFILWNPIATTQVLPGDIVPASKAAHGMEALLAVLAIIIWHMWHVHIRHFNKSIFTGKLTEEEMADEHPAELAAIKAGQGDPLPAPAVLAKRRRIFFPAFAVLTVIMLAGIWFFVGYEKTAIATLPPAEDVTVFVHLTPTPLPTLQPTNTPAPTDTTVPEAEQGGTPAPANTPAPAGEIPSWEVNIASLMAKSCTSCHGASTKLGGLDLSNYQAVLKGGVSGAAVVPGEAHTSLLYTRQASGQHPGQLDAADLALLQQWIEAGALEKPSATPASGAGPTWDGAVTTLLQNKCVSCHNDKVTLGNLDLSSYQAALKGGASGVAIAPGNGEGSTLVIVQSKGGHAGQLSAEELELILQWIAAGAPEK
jgi:formate dehydrogenase gamma subunit